MRVTDISLNQEGKEAVLSAQVIFEENPSKQELWLRFPHEYSPYLTRTGDAFFALGLLLAMASGERLYIDEKVSKEVLESGKRVQEILYRWVKGSKFVDMDIEEASKEIPQGTAVGCFFSGGVDSFYSLLHNLGSHGNDSLTINHLIFVRGFDMHHTDEGHYKIVLPRIKQIAETIGKPLLTVETNIRDISDKLVHWNWYHGSALSGVGLTFISLFKTVIIPATHSYLDLRPYGSHPLLDPLWSTKHTSILHDGCEATRVEKVIRICSSELALETLRVCWKNRNHKYNCGLCEKCLRTMLALYVGGGLERCKTFTNELSISQIRKLSLKNQGYLNYLLDLLKHLRAKTTDDIRLRKELKKAVRRSRIRIAINVLRGRRV